MATITISRQIGAGESSISPELARRLGWELVDHRLLDAQVEKLGGTLPSVMHYDERAPGLLESWTHPHQAQTYFDTLKAAMLEHAARGNVVVVGRAGHLILQSHDALHVRLVADPAFRIRRVMEVRWVAESAAREIISQNDHDRASFLRHYFKHDWSDPVQYDAVLNVSTPGLEHSIQALLTLARLR